MSLRIATHDGPFHADDVLAAAMIRVFIAPDARVMRTRDPEKLATADVVFDVGGVFDPERCCFDHHQRDYRGSKSSAGMVLDWIEESGHIPAAVAKLLRSQLVTYVDAVDIGKRSSDEGVPCFSTIIGILSDRAQEDEFDHWYERATTIAIDIIEGIRVGYERSNSAIAVVHAAMREAVSKRRRVIFFDKYVKWKPAYFAANGAKHPTEYVVFPGKHDWRVVTIPANSNGRRDKRKLPEEWAGLRDDVLSEVIGVPGARFCHKNRFIAIFDRRESVLEALRIWNRL